MVERMALRIVMLSSFCYKEFIMLPDFFIVTNNPRVHNELGNYYHVKFKEGSYRDVLVMARDYIYEGHTLLTHPLAGSIKPNETPYRTVAVSKDKQKPDLESVDIISMSIQTCDKFSMKPKEYSDEVLEDFQQIDYSLIYNAVNVR
jgi:hypothetical protein